MNSSLAANILIFFIKLYKNTISPFLPPACKYYPTCSDYAVKAITYYGAVKGGWLAVYRILRCNPFSKGGYDDIWKKD